MAKTSWKSVKRQSPKRKVSIWIGDTKIQSDVDILKSLCGVKSYNIDDQEISVDDRTWKRVSINELVSELSYSASFSDDVLAECKKRGIDRALYVLAQFDFAFEPKPIHRRQEVVAKAPVFLGIFDWNDDEDDN